MTEAAVLIVALSCYHLTRNCALTSAGTACDINERKRARPPRGRNQRSADERGNRTREEGVQATPSRAFNIERETGPRMKRKRGESSKAKDLDRGGGGNKYYSQTISIICPDVLRRRQLRALYRRSNKSHSNEKYHKEQEDKEGTHPAQSIHSSDPEKTTTELHAHAKEHNESHCP